MKYMKPNLDNILNQKIEELKKKIKREPTSEASLSEKPFAEGMYSFMMFIIEYYSRVRKQLKIDYDSFIIIQTVVTHFLYHLKKKNIKGISYEELEARLFKNLTEEEGMQHSLSAHSIYNKNEILTMSSVSLVTELPKETVRRKVRELVKKNIIKISKKNGITLGKKYSDIFKDFVPRTTYQITKMIQEWEKLGLIKSILNFKK